MGRIGKQLRVLNLGGIKVLPSKTKKIYTEYFNMVQSRDNLKSLFIHQFKLDTTEPELWDETYTKLRSLDSLEHIQIKVKEPFEEEMQQLKGKASKQLDLSKPQLTYDRIEKFLDICDNLKSVTIYRKNPKMQSEDIAQLELKIKSAGKKLIQAAY